MKRSLITTISVVAATTVVVAGGGAAVAGPAAGRVFFVAPTGSDTAVGSQTAPWASIAHAQAVVQPGDTVFFRGGTYPFTQANRACTSQTDRVDAITLNKSGSSGSLIHYVAFPGEKPVFDFSRVSDNCRIKGFDVTGSWIQLKGLEVTGV